MNNSITIISSNSNTITNSNGITIITTKNKTIITRNNGPWAQRAQLQRSCRGRLGGAACSCQGAIFWIKLSWKSPVFGENKGFLKITEFFLKSRNF